MARPYPLPVRPLTLFPTDPNITSPIIIIMASNNTNTSIPPTWPGEARIRKSAANMEPFIIAAMQLIAMHTYALRNV